MPNEFLLKEYECSYEQLRYYDSKNSILLKYLFTLTTSVATAQFAIYKLTSTITQGFWACHFFLSLVVFVATLLIFVSMLQNRIYFVFTAKQLNAIREFLLQTECPEFSNNQLYTSTDFPAIKASSVHTFKIIGAALVSSVFAASSTFAAYPLMELPSQTASTVVAFLVVLLTEIIGGVAYLKITGDKKADEAVHRKPEKDSEPGA